MLVDHILFFLLGPTTALPNSSSGIPSQKASNSSPNPWSLIYAAAWDPPLSSQFAGIIYYYYQLQSYALCQAQMQLQLQKVCFAAEDALSLAVALLQGKQLLQGAVVSVLNIPITSSVLKVSASSKVKSNSWHLYEIMLFVVFFPNNWPQLLLETALMPLFHAESAVKKPGLCIPGLPIFTTITTRI